MPNELRASNLLFAAITALRGDPRVCDEAVQGQREATQGAGPSGSYGALLRFAEGHGLVSGEEWLSMLSALEGGNEHEVFQDPSDSGLLIKVTEPELRLRNGGTAFPR